MAEKKAEDKLAERPAIHINRLRQAEFAYERWRLTAENGTTIEDLKRPAFFAHIAANLRPGAIIEVMPDNRSFFAELLVVDTGPQYARAVVLREVKLEALQAAASAAFPGYSVEFAGDHERWRVIRTADSKVLKSGQPTQTDAFTWLTNHLKALAA